MPHDSPLPRVHTLRSDKGRMQHNELMDLVTKLSDRVVKKLEKTIKTRHARRMARIVVSDDEEDLEDPSKQGRKIAEIDQDLDISLVQHDAEVQGRHEHDMELDFEFTTAEEVYTAEKEGKAIIEEAKTIQTKTKLQLEQERHGYEEALRLQAENDKEERPRIARVQEEASSLNIEEWDDIQARVGDYEAFAQEILQLEDRRSTLKLKKKDCLQSLSMREEITMLHKEEDLVKLWSLVKEKFISTELTEDKERELWVELKRLFEPDTDDVKNIFMMEYPLSRGVLTQMLVAKLLVEQDSEMLRELPRKIFIQVERPLEESSQKTRMEPAWVNCVKVFRVLKGYTDARWINNSEDNSSASGWVFLLGEGAISWASKKQTCITGSTIESEFVALAAAGKEVECATTLAKAYSQMFNGKSRHLGVKHSMIRELITNGVISIEFVRSQQNLADHLTKGLARDLVIKSAEGMGLKSN
ncbi:hypothetical protein Tco_0757770 [Tanacetum coccineum]